MAQVYVQRRNPFFDFGVNISLIIVNVIAFVIFSVLLYFYPNYLQLIAIKPENIIQGKYLWTFLTSMFMHGGIFHLFANMFSMLFVGSLVEKIIGQRRYFWFYILSGIFAGLFFVLASLFFTADYTAFAVGASGALFALVGFLMVITPNQPVYLMFVPIPIKMKYAAPGLLVVLWLISITAGLNVGNTAHLGGLIAGLGYGFYIRKKYKNKARAISRYFS